ASGNSGCPPSSGSTVTPPTPRPSTRRCSTAALPSRCPPMSPTSSARAEKGGKISRVACSSCSTPSARTSPRSIPLDASVKTKLETIATRGSGADGVEYPKKVDRQIAQAETLGYGRLPVCVAKTQRSLSDDPTLLNRPRGFKVMINDVRISAGAGFLVAQAGEITTMPALPRRPHAEGVGVTETGAVTGLF